MQRVFQLSNLNSIHQSMQPCITASLFLHRISGHISAISSTSHPFTAYTFGFHRSARQLAHAIHCWIRPLQGFSTFGGRRRGNRVQTGVPEARLGFCGVCARFVHDDDARCRHRGQGSGSSRGGETATSSRFLGVR